MLPEKVLPRVCIARATVYIYTLATDIQFHIFNFQICLPWLFTKKELIVHIQCLLRVDGSIVAGVFLTFFFCVVPESPYSSDAASSSPLVAWYLNCSSAASSTKSTVASETGSCSAP